MENTVIKAVLVLAVSTVVRSGNGDAVPPCTNNPCFNGGTCLQSNNYYSCACTECYTGYQCQSEIDPCANHNCQNGASCEPLTVFGSCTDYTCKCASCFTGFFCEVSVNTDPCEAHLCQNGGKCVPVPGSCTQYTCECDACYTGELCARLNNDGCSPDPCQGGICLPSFCGEYVCICPPGFTGKNCTIQRENDEVFPPMPITPNLTSSSPETDRLLLAHLHIMEYGLIAVGILLIIILILGVVAVLKLRSLTERVNKMQQDRVGTTTMSGYMSIVQDRSNSTNHTYAKLQSNGYSYPYPELNGNTLRRPVDLVLRPPPPDPTRSNTETVDQPPITPEYLSPVATSQVSENKSACDYLELVTGSTSGENTNAEPSSQLTQTNDGTSNGSVEQVDERRPVHQLIQGYERPVRK
ncbi:uncharacterized protein LOC144435304 [Glandiceps talaboti]